MQCRGHPLHVVRPLLPRARRRRATRRCQDSPKCDTSKKAPDFAPLLGAPRAISPGRRLGLPPAEMRSTVCAAVPAQMPPPSWEASTRTSITVGWPEAAADAGAPVGAYRLYRALGDGPFFRVYEGAARSHESVGLSPGVTYRFAVSALGEAGEGERSQPHGLICAAPPGKVSGVSFASSSRTDTVISWTPPVDDGGSEIVGYEASWSQTLPTFGRNRRGTASDRRVCSEKWCPREKDAFRFIRILESLKLDGTSEFRKTRLLGAGGCRECRHGMRLVAPWPLFAHIRAGRPRSATM